MLSERGSALEQGDKTLRCDTALRADRALKGIQYSLPLANGGPEGHPALGGDVPLCTL